jgi:hypothetical protein
VCIPGERNNAKALKSGENRSNHGTGSKCPNG